MVLAAWMPRLHRDLGDPGEVVQRDHVADGEHLGMAGQRAVVEHGDPAGAVARRPARLREQAGQRRGLHAGRPDLGAGHDALLRAVLGPYVDPEGVDAGDHRPGPDGHAETSQLARGLLGEPVAERGQDLRAAVEEHDRRVGRVDVAEVAREPASATARRSGRPPRPRSAPAPTTTNVSQRAPGLGVGLALGHLEGAEDAAAQLQRVVDRLHARREARELVVAEVRLRRAGGDDEAVVLVGAHRLVGSVGSHGARVQVEARAPWPAPRETLPWRRSTSRIGGAISPSDRMPVASW